MDNSKSFNNQYENPFPEAFITWKEIMLTSVTKAITAEINAAKFNLKIILISRVERMRVFAEVTKNKSIINADPAPNAKAEKCIENKKMFICNFAKLCRATSYKARLLYYNFFFTCVPSGVSITS